MIEIWTDGACTLRFENGEYLPGKGGWAYAIVKNGEIIKKDSGYDPSCTNNIMELKAIFEAIKAGLEYNEKLIVYSDSAYCVDTFNKWIYSWEKNNWTRGKGKEIKNLAIIQSIWSMMKGNNNVELKKVKGHSDDRFNNLVDEMAVAAKNGEELKERDTSVPEQEQDEVIYVQLFKEINGIKRIIPNKGQIKFM